MSDSSPIVARGFLGLSLPNSCQRRQLTFANNTVKPQSYSGLQISVGADLRVCPGGRLYTESGTDTQVRPYRQ